MKHVLITGANRGIGLELCRQLSQRGERVTAVCRRSSDALDGLGVEVIEGIDVSEADCVGQLADKVKGRKFDWLINNAGVLVRDRLGQADFDDIQRQFVVNSMGPLRVTSALLPNLDRGAKVGIVTSRMGSVGDNTSGGYYGYRMSKAAVNMAGVCLACDLKERGISVVLLHPGWVATDMGGSGGVPVDRSATGLIERMDELDMASSGTFRHADGRELPW